MSWNEQAISKTKMYNLDSMIVYHSNKTRQIISLLQAVSTQCHLKCKVIYNVQRNPMKSQRIKLDHARYG